MVHEELGAKVRRLQQAVGEIHGVTQLNGVTIWTDANGRLTGLDVSYDAYGRGPGVLADLIMRAYEQTADDVQQRTTAVMAELRDDPIVARIADATDDSRSEPESHGREAATAATWFEGQSQPGARCVEQQGLLDGPHVESANRSLHEGDEVGGTYYQRKSWLE